MKIKVVHISVATTGGAGIAAFRLHKALLNSGEVDSFFIQQISKEDKKEPNTSTIDRRRYTYKDRIFSKLGFGVDRKNQKRISIINKCDCEIATLPDTNYRIEDDPIVKSADVINLHWVADFLNYPTFFKNINKPIVWTIHDMNPFSGIFHYEEDLIRNQNISGKLNREVFLEKLRAIHNNKNIFVVSPSEWLKSKSIKSRILGIYPHFNIPNCIDFSSIKIVEKGEARTKLNINKNYTFLFISHDIEIKRKGFDLLVSALNNIELDINLITIGGKKIEINSSVNHIHYDRIDDVQLLNLLYSAVDMTILPSREDNLPNVMLESFANGTPIMSFHNGGMADYIIPNKTGILVPEITSQALANSIAEVINRNIKFDADIIRDFANSYFEPSSQSLKYINLYHQILKV